MTENELRFQLNNSSLSLENLEKIAQALKAKPVITDSVISSIVGVSCRFGGGVFDLESLSNFILNGKVAISDECLPRCFDDKDEENSSEQLSLRAAFIDGVDQFDPLFFGISPIEAREIDPQHRIALMAVWEAMENAGITHQQLQSQKVGIYVASASDDYQQLALAPDRADLVSVYTSLGTSRSSIAGRISYLLGLDGPAVQIDTACSSSLVALHIADQALKSGDCDMAFVIGVNLILAPSNAALRKKLNAVSVKGECRPFDSEADGFVQGEGIGALLLKTQSAAKQDGDKVYVNVLASSCNHNGGGNGLMAPNGEAQVKLLRQTLEKSKLTADDIQFVEAHGTGTKLGDPIEVQAINQVYGQNKRLGALYIGSAKANFGHLEAGAGLLSVIKVIACMEKEIFPPQANFSTPNEYIEWADGKAQVNTQVQPWTAHVKGGRNAAVSSFGITGTNAHVILGQPNTAITLNSQTTDKACDYSMPLVFSAKTPQSLQAILTEYAEFTKATDLSLCDISFTLTNGRTHFEHRAAICAHSLEEAHQQLEQLLNTSEMQQKRSSKLVFCFTGQGAQYLGMGKQLYQYFAPFREAFEQVAVLFERERGQDLKTIMWGDDEAVLNDTANAQAALFAYEYAIYKLWHVLGVEPQAVIGHSLGEYVAAHVAGILSLEDAFKLVLFRSSTMSKLPSGGGMLSVRAEQQEILSWLAEYNGLEICAFNNASLTVIGGPRAQLQRLQQFLDTKDIISIELSVSHAFHTEAMTPVMPGLEQLCSQMSMTPPKLPIISNLTGQWIKKEDLTSSYWSMHLRQPVQFFCGIRALNDNQFFDFLEMGPKGVLSNIVSAIDTNNRKLSHYVMGDEISSIYQTATALFNCSENINWAVLFAPLPVQKVRLPHYKFNLARYWLEDSTWHHNSRNNKDMYEIQDNDQLIQVTQKVTEIFSEILGIPHTQFDVSKSLLEVGADSFVLVMAIKRLKEAFGVEISIRDIFEKYVSLEKISHHILANASKDSIVQLNPKVVRESVSKATVHAEPEVTVSVVPQKMEISSNTSAYVPPTFTFNEEPEQTYQTYNTSKPQESALSGSSLTLRQQQYMTQFIAKYNQKTAKSKQKTQRYKSVLCNNRKSSSGFRMEVKDLAYSIQCDASYGSKVVDIDGNEYVDLAMGFGATLFGHRPEFIERQLQAQLSKGYQIGPESHLAGECAQMICDVTGMDRALFANSGTEAVMTAIRIARAYNKRKKVVVFQNAYHGHFDSTLCMPNVEGDIGDSVPMAIGTPMSLVEDIVVLPFNAVNSLDYILANADEISAVITEPVQNRDPGADTSTFLKQLRKVTEQKEIILIFDEVLVGFRIALAGAQQWFDIKADMATYGKVIGGGLPIGVVSGRRDIMDKVDGGQWQFGDNSAPAEETTYTAGTFCKHPLAMTACHASLTEMISKGPKLQQILNQKTDKLIQILNEVFTAHQVPLQAKNFGSFFRIAQQGNLSFVYQPLELDIFFYHMIAKGIYFWEGKTCFLSTAHTQADIQKIINAANDSVLEMKAVGFWQDELVTDNNSTPSVSASEGQTVKKSQNSSVLNRAMRKNSDTSTTGEKGVYQVQYPDSIADESFLAKVNKQNEMDFGLYFFGNDANDKIEQIIDVAKYADQSGLQSLWLPERHFNQFAGFSPNPAIIGAAIANATENLQIRASVVSSLRHPISIAEEWSILDNISGGRTGVAMASGWFVNDFVLNPSAWGQQRDVMLDNMNAVQHLWKGHKLSLPAVESSVAEVELFPRPVQSGLPMWLTTLGNKQNYIDAGRKGIGVLTNMIGQKVSDLAENIRLYKESRAQAGFDPEGGHVTVLLHTLISDDRQQAIEIAREPFVNYLASSVGLFQKMVAQEGLDANFDILSEDDKAFLLNAAYERYTKGNALIGDIQSCTEVIQNLKDIGVNEVACFVDFGVPPEKMKEYLPNVVKLSQHFSKQKAPEYSSLAPIIKGESGLSNVQVKQSNELREAVQKLPLTDDQKMLWFIAKTGTDGMMAYSQSLVLNLNGKLDEIKLQRAVNDVVRRHNGLRTVVDIDGEYQSVMPRYELPMEHFDLSLLDAHRRDEQLEQLQQMQANKTFDFSKPLIRVSLIKLAEQKYQLMLTTHHLVCDGVSVGVILTELAALYDSYCQNKELVLPHTLQFSEFVTWRNGQYQELECQREEVFWLSKVAEQTDQMLNLPFDYSRPAIKTYQGSRFVMTLDKAFFNRLKEFAKSKQSTYFMVVLGAFYCLLYRLCRQHQITVGIPFSGRSLKDSESMVGYLSNVYPIMLGLNGEESINEFIVRLRSELLDAYSNQNYPFSSLIEKGNGRTDASQSPFFNVAFNWDRVYVPEMSGLEVSGYNLKPNYVEYDLMVNVLEVNDEIEMSWDFNSDLFKQTTIEHISLQFKHMLTHFIEQPTQAYAKLPLESESIQLQHIAPKPSVDYKLAHQLLVECAQKYPNKLAVRCEQEILDYKTLDLLATKLANRLQNRGVTRGDCVALCLPPSVALVVAIHGVIKLGAYYLPLNTRYPASQLQGIVDDAQAKVVIRAKELFEDAFSDKSKQVMLLDKHIKLLKNCPKKPVAVDINRTDTAYVIYTSGSTGKPKGVRITHQNLASFCQSALNRLKIDGSETFLNVSPASFDMSIPDIFLPLMSAGQLILATEEQRLVPSKILQLLEQYEIGFMQATPTTWKGLMEHGFKGRANMVCCLGGEMLPSTLARQFDLEALRVFNVYGPTETTVWSNILRLKAEHLHTASVPVGPSLDNAVVYIVDEHMQPVPTGHCGEVLIGGLGVANGYLNQPQLSKEKFIENPWGDGQLYRSGDLGRWDLNKGLVILGRADNQVKIRGFRIELDEVEAVLSAHPDVSQAAVITQPGLKGGLALIGFVELATGVNTSGHDIRAALKRELADYMVPTVVKVLDELPRSGNGKIDRRSLPNVDISQESTPYKAPTSESERQLCDIIGQLLDCDKVSVTGDFFELGGTSLDLARLQRQIQSEFNFTVAITDLFKETTARGIARLITQSDATGTVVDKQVPNQTNAHSRSEPTKQVMPLTPAVSYHFEHLGYRHYLNLVKLYDLISEDISEQILSDTVKTLVETNEVFTVSLSEREDGQFMQFIGDVSPTLQIVDFSDIEITECDKKLEIHIAELQGKFELQRHQPLVRFVLFKTPAALPNKFLMLCHFALIDAYGMELLAMQLAKQLNAYMTGTPVRLTSGTSYSQWLQAYRQFANDAAKEDLSYWLNQPWHKVARLDFAYKKPHSELGRFYQQQDHIALMAMLTGQQQGDEETIRQLSASHTIHLFSMTPIQTEKLKQVVSNAQLELIDVLLAAYYLVLKPHLSQSFLPVDFMFSNRKPMMQGINISETVMRAAENVILPIDVTESHLFGAAKQVCQQREAMPHGGTSLPALKKFNRDPLITQRLETLPMPQVGFNYLSLWSQQGVMFEEILRPSSILCGSALGNTLDRERGVWLQLYVDESIDSLNLAFTYEAHRLTHLQVEQLAEQFVSLLESASTVQAEMQEVSETEV